MTGRHYSRLTTGPILADVTGVEPAPNCVTGRHLNRLTSHPYFLSKWWDSNPHRTIMFIPDPKSGRIPIAYTPSYILRSRRELNPLFRLPTRHRDRVVHQPLCAETVYFVTLGGIEPPF